MTAARRPPIRPITRGDVRKADKNTPVACYDAAGNLIGTCDPRDLVEIANPAPAEPTEADVAKARALLAQVKETFAKSGNAAEQARLADKMNAAAAVRFQQIRGTGRQA